MAVTVEQKVKMYDTPENTSINESHGIPSQDPDAPSQWGWQSFLTLINHLGVQFSQIKGVATSVTNPGASKIGDVWFYSQVGSYPYFGTPVTERNEIGFFQKGASSFSKKVIASLETDNIKDPETGKLLSDFLEDISFYNSSSSSFKTRGENIKDASIQLYSFSQAVLDYIGSGGTITNNPDERHLDKFNDGVEKLRIKDGFEGKTYLYNPGQYATSSDLKTAVEALAAGGNKHIVISDVVDGGGLTWTLPTGTIIDVAKSGLISNVTLDGDYEIIEKSYKIFGDDVTFNGSPIAKYVTPEMFGAQYYIGGTPIFDSSTAINLAIKLAQLTPNDTVNFINKRYSINKSVRFYDTTVVGDVELVMYETSLLPYEQIGYYDDKIGVVACNGDENDVAFFSGFSGTSVFVGNVIMDVKYGDAQFKVDDIGDLERGDVILITSRESIIDDDNTYGAVRGELLEVKDAYNGIITTIDSIRENHYKTQYLVKIFKIKKSSFSVRDSFKVTGLGNDVSSIGFYLTGVCGTTLNRLYSDNSSKNGIRFHNCYKTTFLDPRVTNCYGEDDAQGYAIYPFGATTDCRVVRPVSQNCRHDIDYGNGIGDWDAGGRGRQWIYYDDINLVQDCIYGTGAIGPHEGTGYMYINGGKISSPSRDLSHDVQWVKPASPAVGFSTGDIVFDYYLYGIGERRYISLVDNNDNDLVDADKKTQTDYWRVIWSDYANYAEQYNPITPYVIGNQVRFNGKGYINILDGTGQQPDISPSYWEEDTYAAYLGSGGVTGRLNVRKISVKNVVFENLRSGVLGMDNCDELEVIGNTFKNVPNSLPFPTTANSVLGRQIIEDNILIDSYFQYDFVSLNTITSNYNYIKYKNTTIIRGGILGTDAYLPNGIKSIIFDGLVVEDIDVACRFYKTYTSQGFDELIIKNLVTTDLNNRILGIRVQDAIKDFKRIVIDGIDYRFTSESNVSNIRELIFLDDDAIIDDIHINMANIDLSDAPTCNMKFFYTNNVDSIRINNFKITNSTLRLNDGLGNRHSQYYYFSGTTLNGTALSSRENNFNWVIVEDGDHTDSKSVTRFTTKTSPEGLVTANVNSKCYDETNDILYLKKSGTGNTGWGVVQGDGSDESALTTYTLDCRLNNKFKKTIGAATTFTFNVDGYAVGQFIKFNIWAEANAGVGVAPSYDLSTGTLTVKSKASNYDNTLFTNIEVGLYITASGADAIIYETSA